MAESLMGIVQWSSTSYSIQEFLDNYEPRFPILALVKSVGAPPKTEHNLTNTETIFVGQVLKIDSATEGQKRLIIEVVPQGLPLNIPLDCPAKFDIPHLKKKKLKLKKILSSPKYALPLVAETSSKYSAYFEKAGAKATGDARRRTVKMVFKKVKERERFLKTNFIHEGTESPLVTFISADLPIELAIVEGYIGPGTEERLTNKYQLIPSAARAKGNDKRKKRPPDGQMVIGAGLYIMIETSPNNNYIINRDSSAEELSSRGAAAADAYIEDDVDGIEFDEIDTEQNSRVNAIAAATEEQEEREAEEDDEEEEEEEGNSRQRNGELPASFPELSDRVVSQRVDGEKNETAAAATAVAERKNERELSTEDYVQAKQEQVSQNIDSKLSSLSSVQGNPGQSNAEETSQNSRSAALNEQLVEPEIRVEESQDRGESPESVTERQIYAYIRRRSEIRAREVTGSKTNLFDDVSLESEEEESIKSLGHSTDRIEDEEMQRKRIAQVAPVAQELKRPTPAPRQSLRAKKSQELITEMNLGSTGVFCVELLPLSQLDSDHRKLYNGGPLRRQASISDDEDETSNERFSERNSIRMNSRTLPTQKRNFSPRSVSSSDSFSPKNDSGRAQVENVFFFGESFISPPPPTATRYAVGISSDRNTKSKIVTATDSGKISRTSTERTQTNMFSWSKAPLSQAYSLDRRQTYQAKAVRSGSQNTDDASTQTMSYPSIDRRTIDEDSFAVVPYRSVARSQSKTVVQMSGAHQPPHSSHPSAASDADEIHGEKVRRNNSIIHRIILNDSEQATCQITSFTSTPSNDRSTTTNVSYRIPSFRAEPSISTLPRKWTSSTPAQTPRTSSSSNAHRHIVTVELPPYFEGTNMTSFNHDATVRGRMVDAPSGRFVYGADQWKSSKSTSDLAVKPDGSSRVQTTVHTGSEPFRSEASMPRENQEIGYTIRINTHEDRPSPGLPVDRRTRSRQNKGQDGFRQTGSKAEMETVNENAQMSPMPNENVVVTSKEEGDYKFRKTIGRSRTTVSDAPRNLNQPGHIVRSEGKFLDEPEVGRPAGNTSRPVGRLHCTTRTSSLDNPIHNQRTEEPDLQSKERKGVLTERVGRSGLVLTTTERVRQSNDNELMTQEQNHHVASNGKAPEVPKYRGSARITPEQNPNHNLSAPVQARRAQRNTRTLEEFDYCDSSMQSPNHQRRRIDNKMDEAENRSIEQFQPQLRVRTSEKVIGPRNDVRSPEEFRRSNIPDRSSVGLPVQNSKQRTQTLEKQSSDVRRADQAYHATRKQNGIHQSKHNRADMKQNRNTDQILIQTQENEFAFSGNSRRSAYNDDIKTTSNEKEKVAQKKPRHQSCHKHRDNAKAAPSATSGYNQNKQQNHSYSTTKQNTSQPTNSTEYPSSTAPIAAVNGVHEKSSRDLKVSTSVRSTLEAYPQIPPSQAASISIGEVHQTKASKRRRNKEIAADQELTYPIDMTVRDTIRALDSFLKEQDPDAQSIASSQFTEHHELVIHRGLTGMSNF